MDGNSFLAFMNNMRKTAGFDVELVRGDPGNPTHSKASRCVKNTDKGPLAREYFSFPPQTDIEEGDMIQVNGSRNSWIVKEIEDHMLNNVCIQTKAYYEKPSSKPIKKTVVPLALNNFHIEVQSAASSLVASGHLRQAILDTFISLDRYVKQKTGLSESGTSLMSKAFSGNSPVLKISDHLEEQVGFMNLFQGAMKAIRNQYAHDTIEPETEQIALEWLAYASALFRLVDAAKSE